MSSVQLPPTLHLCIHSSTPSISHPSILSPAVSPAYYFLDTAVRTCAAEPQTPELATYDMARPPPFPYCDGYGLTLGIVGFWCVISIITLLLHVIFLIQRLPAIQQHKRATLGQILRLPRADTHRNTNAGRSHKTPRTPPFACARHRAIFYPSHPHASAWPVHLPLKLAQFCLRAPLASMLVLRILFVGFLAAQSDALARAYPQLLRSSSPSPITSHLALAASLKLNTTLGAYIPHYSQRRTCR
ncbi:hypothetical protein B0H13DRAFT_2411575 [Mycena leptocephala]|nr:hypothetical protein B0H13DRAFT_2411575 [Mycena leptocephala]